MKAAVSEETDLMTIPAHVEPLQAKAGRVRFVSLCFVLLALRSMQAAEAMRITAPLELQVSQRTKQDAAAVVISGTVSDAVDVVEAKADLAEGAKRGKPVGWTVIAAGRDMLEGTFTGRLPLAAGGWYTVTVRARRGGKTVAETAVARVGVGDVFVTAGQSNSANFGKPRQAARDDRVVYSDGRRFVPARDPIPGACGTGGSVWPILGDLLVRSQNVPVCFRSASLTWTEVKNWMPDARRGKFFLYGNLVRCVTAFGTNGVRAVLWHQGESDSLARTPAETYCSRLQAVIETLNRDAGYAIPWFVAQASFHPGAKEPDQQEVARGQRLLWESGIARRGPVTDDLLGPEYRCDGVHFNQQGLVKHAERWFEALSVEYK